jgi:hypothetical protein
VLVDLPNRSILPRYKNSSSIDVAGIFKPVSTRLSSAFPSANYPALFILESHTDSVIEAVGLVVLAANTNDVQIVLTVLKYSVAERSNIIKNKWFH